MFTGKRKGTQVDPSPTTIRSSSARETRELGRSIGETLRGGEIVLLTGSLGTGKSVFARGVADALGVTHWRGSPTFALVHEYTCVPSLIHLDLYRLSRAEVEDLGLEEYARIDSVIVAEWADRAISLLQSLPRARLISVDFEHVSESERALTLLDDAGMDGRRAC